MNRIIVLSSVYLGIPSANGICARNVVAQLKNFGNEVEVICYEDEVTDFEDCIVHTVKKKDYNKHLRKLSVSDQLRRAINMLSMNIDGFIDKDLVSSYYYTLKQIHEKRSIDAVVAMYFPIESLHAAYLFKRDNPSVCVISYELDSIDDGVASSRIQKYYNRICRNWIDKVYSFIDYSVIMKSHEVAWISRFNSYKEKMLLADIPVLTEKELNSEPVSEKLTMVYSGLIEREYRSPTYLLETLLNLSAYRDFNFLFFSKGDCEDEIHSFAKQYSGIKQMGFVKPEVLNQYISNADFLISIGNSVSRSLPSKLISYIACGKPIIHFSSQDEDVCAEYLSAYPLSLIINQNDEINESCNAIMDFIDENRGKSIDFETVRKIFFLNDPKHSAETICRVISKY